MYHRKKTLAFIRSTASDMIQTISLQEKKTKQKLDMVVEYYYIRLTAFLPGQPG